MADWKLLSVLPAQRKLGVGYVWINVIALNTIVIIIIYFVLILIVISQGSATSLLLWAGLRINEWRVGQMNTIKKRNMGIIHVN